VALQFLIETEIHFERSLCNLFVGAALRGRPFFPLRYPDDLHGMRGAATECRPYKEVARKLKTTALPY